MPRPKSFCKEDVLKKAMELFWQKGYEATSVQDLVEHLGINKQSLYDTFGDKQTLYSAALKNYRAEHEMQLSEMNFEGSSVKATFRKLFEKAISNTCEDPQKKGCFLNNATVELASQNKEIGAICTDWMKSFETKFGKLIKQGQNTGEIRKELDAESTVAYFYVVLSGLAAVGKINEDRKKLEKVIENTLAILD